MDADTHKGGEASLIIMRYYLPPYRILPSIILDHSTSSMDI